MFSPNQDEAAVRPPGFFGQLDGVEDGEAYGWAFDAGHPDQAVKVLAYVNGRPVAEALAGYYRPDVAEQLGCSGRNGFYIDLAHFCRRASSAIVDIRLPDGRLVEGAPLRAYLPDPSWSSSPALLFMHIPKTGGTALREAVLGNYRQSAVAYLYPEAPGFPIRDLRDLPLEQRRRFRLVVGHFQFGVHTHIPGDYSYFTVVREPLSRVWSHYNYLVQQHETRSLEEMIESKATVNLDNMMVRCFAGVDERDFPPGSIDGGVFDLAVYNASHAFACVGLQEHMDDAYNYLRQKYGWRSAALAIMNRGTYGSEQRSETDRRLIRHSNKWDFQLFEHIVRASGKRQRSVVA